MPNYSLVVDATFQPFTYQELAAPIQQATEKHEQLMDKYDELTLTSQQYGRYVGPEGSKSKAMYDKYMSDLTNARDMLNQYGLARSGRSMLSGVRSSYANNMMPLQDAFATRKQEAADQQRAAMADPTIRFSRTASTTDLDYYLDNPNGGYKPVSGKVVQAQVGAAMAALSKRIMTPGSPEQQAAQQVMRPDEFYKAINYGISPDMIPEFYKNDMLRSVVNQVLGGYGMSVGSDGRFHTDGTFDQTVTNDIGNMAVTGLYAGVGQTQLIEDKRAVADMNFQYSERAAQNAFDRNVALEQIKHANTMDEIEARYGTRSGAGSSTGGSDGSGMVASDDGSYNVFTPVEFEGKPKDTAAVEAAKKQLGSAKTSLNSAGISISNGRMSSTGISVGGNKYKTTISLYNSDGSLKSRNQFINEAQNRVHIVQPSRQVINGLLEAGVITTADVRKMKFSKINGVEYTNDFTITINPTARNGVTYDEVERIVGRNQVLYHARTRVVGLVTGRQAANTVGTQYDKAVSSLQKQYGNNYKTLKGLNSAYNKEVHKYNDTLSKAGAKEYTYFDTGYSLDDITLNDMKVQQVKEKTPQGYKTGDVVSVRDLKKAGLENSDVYLSYNNDYKGLVIRGDRNGRTWEYIIPYSSFSNQQKAYFDSHTSADAIRLMSSFGYKAEYSAFKYNQSLPASEQY